MRDRVPAIARATFLEAVRDRVLLVVALFTLGVVLFSRVLGWLSIEDEMKLVQDFSLSGMNVLALLLAMLVGAFSLAREVERRTLYPLLSRDLTRSEFVLGKYFGLVGASWVCMVGAALALATWVCVWGGRPGAAFVAAVTGLLFETLLLTAVALFLGSLAAPTLAALGTCVFAFAAHSTEALRELVSDGKSPTFAAVYAVVYKFMPNLEDVNFINATTTGQPVHWRDLMTGGLSVSLWSAAFVVGATLLFRKREV